MELTREYIENLKVGLELDELVNKYVFNNEKPCWKYSSDIGQTKRIIDKYYEDILINFLTPINSFSYGWHCNIKGVHSKANVSMEEAVCKASIIYNVPKLWKDTEICENERHQDTITMEDINRVHDIVTKLEEEKLYTKTEIKKLMRCK